VNTRKATFRFWTILALAAPSVAGTVSLHAQSVQRASDASLLVVIKETVLKYDLFQMREAIDKYHTEKKRYPKKLGSLVGEGYISQIPADPFTNRADWKPVHKPSEGPGVFDLRSASNATAVDGTAYSQW
jgi:general secretion pathway protein G